MNKLKYIYYYLLSKINIYSYCYECDKKIKKKDFLFYCCENCKV